MASSLISQQQQRLPGNFKPFKEENFNFSDKDLENLRDLKFSSTGNFSLLRLAELKNEKRTVALKTVTVDDNKEVYAMVELSILMNIKNIHDENFQRRTLSKKESEKKKIFKHDHVIEFIGAFRENGRIVMVTDFLERGDVKKALKPDLQFFKQEINATDLDFVWKQRLRVAMHVAYALRDLHSISIVHRDIKSENIFLTGRGRKTICKLGDFGFARGIHSIEADETRTYTICGTDHLMAPEMLLGMPYNHSVDIFSYGCVLVELICGRGPSPFDLPSEAPMEESDDDVLTSKDLRDVVANLNKEDDDLHYGGDFLRREPKDSFEINFAEVQKYALAGCPLELVEVAKQCLEYEPKYRISSEDLVETLEDLEARLIAKQAERVPSKVKPKEWVFDNRRGTFVSNQKKEPEKNLKNIQSMYDLVSPESVKTVHQKIGGKGVEGNYVLDMEKENQTPSTLISKHSKTNSMANVARRQLRQVSRHLSVRARNTDLAKMANDPNLMHEGNVTVDTKGSRKSKFGSAFSVTKRFNFLGKKKKDNLETLPSLAESHVTEEKIESSSRNSRVGKRVQLLQDTLRKNHSRNSQGFKHLPPDLAKPDI